MAAEPQEAPRHAGQVVRRVLLRRNIAIDAETAQLVADAVQAALQPAAPSRPPRRRPRDPTAGSEPLICSTGYATGGDHLVSCPGEPERLISRWPGSHVPRQPGTLASTAGAAPRKADLSQAPGRTGLRTGASASDMRHALFQEGGRQ